MIQSDLSITIKVPGSSMLLGEHAVLYGYPALVCAVNQYMTVTLHPRKDRNIHIFSKTLGSYQTNLDHFSIEQPFDFILYAIEHWKEQLPSGFDLTIVSEFSHKIGLGSSAAVAIGTLAALQYWLTGTLEYSALQQIGIEVIRKGQGLGSGGDVLASVYGGILYYRSDSLKFEKISSALPIHLVYAGYKTSTVEVVRLVQKIAQTYPKIFSKLFLAMGQCVEDAKTLIQQERLEELGKVFNIHQSLQDAIGVNDQYMQAIINECCRLPDVLGAKISGAGLGDCVLILGKVPKNYFPRGKQQRGQGFRQIPVSVATTGVRVVETPRWGVSLARGAPHSPAGASLG